MIWACSFVLYIILWYFSCFVNIGNDLECTRKQVICKTTPDHIKVPPHMLPCYLNHHMPGSILWITFNSLFKNCIKRHILSARAGYIFLILCQQWHFYWKRNLWVSRTHLKREWMPCLILIPFFPFVELIWVYAQSLGLNFCKAIELNNVKLPHHFCDDLFENHWNSHTSAHCVKN